VEFQFLLLKKECRLKMYDIIGDVHGCLVELTKLLEKLGYNTNTHNHPKGRRVIFLGDICDRGWYSYGTYQLVQDMVMRNRAMLVRGNHDDKLLRFFEGKGVVQNHGLDKTILDFQKNCVDAQSVVKFLSDVPFFLSLHNDKLIVVHAAWKNSFWVYGCMNKKCRTWCLFAPNRGMREDGFPDRVDWVGPRQLTDESPIIVYGHQPYLEPRIENKTYGIDTGCVFGGKLTALRYPEMDLVSVGAERCYADSETRWGICTEGGK
jgi:protein phosphatase